MNANPFTPPGCETHPGGDNDIRQSSEFSSFMHDIGWKTVLFNGKKVYLRKFPLVGYFAKCPRPGAPLSFSGFTEFLKNNNIFRFKIAPNIPIDSSLYKQEKNKINGANFSVDVNPFNPTTTIIVDLMRNEKEIFKSFSEAKRRGVRKAMKNNISILRSDNIDAFIKIRERQFYPLGILIKKEMQMLWQNFYPEKSDLLLAKTSSEKIVAGILLLYHNHTAYYWFASSLPLAKKLFAPTLLVWEAIKLAKQKNCRALDFEGVYDERFPKASQSWRGFTKFKEGFSEKKTVLMENFYLKRSILSL